MNSKGYGSENQHLQDAVMEKILLQLALFDERLQDLETGSGGASRHGTNALETLRKEVGVMRSEISLVNKRAGNMRLDRQIKLAVKRVLSRSKTLKRIFPDEQARIAKMRAAEALRIKNDMTISAQLIVICSRYPGGARDYGGEFIQKRVEAYIAGGLEVVVVEASLQTKVLQRHWVNNAEVLRVNPAGVGKVLRLSEINVLCLHSVEKLVWNSVKPYANDIPTFVWVHGFEARPWQELAFNYTHEELEDLRPKLEQLNEDRKETMRSVFEHPNVQTIFVSDYMRDVAEKFAETQAAPSHIIHNSISPQDFPYMEKPIELRKKILWVRSFDAKNYANDISRDVILELSKKPYFKDITVSIFGGGRYFEEITAPLADFSNVQITNGFLDLEGLRQQHALHGVMLVPSRWDSQGLTCGEAMHSGLVPLASHIGGVSEFVDESCAILAPFDRVKELVDGYDKLIKNPDLFVKLSSSAAKRSAKQCNPTDTLHRELQLVSKAL